MADGIDSKSIGLRAQKKLLGKMTSKKIAKQFIDDTSGRLLDNLYKVAKDYSGSKKDAEKIIKHLIKTVIKIGILTRNDQFSREELAIAEEFKRKFRTVAMTVVSFYEVDFTFDKNYLNKALNECGSLLKQLVQRHLTEKSLWRIDNVFHFFSNPDFLEALFKSNGQHKELLCGMVRDLNKLLDDGVL